MNILSICAGAHTTSQHNFKQTTLNDSTPFGYDLVIVNTASAMAMYGISQGHTEINRRWKNFITKWSDGNRKIIILGDNLDINALQWLPIGLSAMNSLGHLESAGNGTFLGNIISTDPFLRRFLTENKDSFRVNRYLRCENLENTNITPNSGVDASLLTSFTYKKDGLEIIFLPPIPMQNLLSIFSSLDTPANAWGITAADELTSSISTIDGKINTLHARRDALYEELNTLNARIAETIGGDVYLSRAISHYDATRASENPSPESYYGAVEAIENAFSSEREMRDELGLTKAYVDKVMRRANEFRHEAKSGAAPTPLTDDEISDLNERVNKIISCYIQYLLSHADSQ